jgi:hypothetical protein
MATSLFQKSKEKFWGFGGSLNKSTPKPTESTTLEEQKEVPETSI